MFDNLNVHPNDSWKSTIYITMALGASQLLLVALNIQEKRSQQQISRMSRGTLGTIGVSDALMSFLLQFYANRDAPNFWILTAAGTFYGIAAFLTGLLLEKVILAHTLEDGITWRQVLQHVKTTRNPKPPPLELFENIRFTNQIILGGLLCVLAIASVMEVASRSLPPTRTTIEYVLLLFLSSYWLPQIAKNSLRNRNVDLLWLYMIGSTVLRIVPVFYLCTYSNAFEHRNDTQLWSTITLWLGLQLFFLALQRMWSPRFWVKDLWLPVVFDYDRELGEDDVKIISKEYELDTLSDIVVECTVCDKKLRLHSDEKTAKVSVTPCYHVFHKECLAEKMMFRLLCPKCRNGIPL